MCDELDGAEKRDRFSCAVICHDDTYIYWTSYNVGRDFGLGWAGMNCNEPDRAITTPSGPGRARFHSPVLTPPSPQDPSSLARVRLNTRQKPYEDPTESHRHIPSV
ncbi:hypothetical protein V2G26_000294 [Clonostachys chloroleuca]